MGDIDKQWENLKEKFYIRYKFYGEITNVKPFGVFVYLGYQVIDGYKPSGIIDIPTKPDCDSSGLAIASLKLVASRFVFFRLTLY